MKRIVEKLDGFPPITSIEVEEPVKIRPGEDFHFKVYATAETEGSLKKAVIKPGSPSWGAFSILCDEGTAIGGQDSAPSPLGYFTAGVVCCLLSHLVVMVRASDINVNSMKIEFCQSFSTNLATLSGKLDDDSRMWGKSTGMEFHVLIDSDEPPEVILELHKQALNACMATQALIQPVPMNAYLHHNGNLIE